MHTARFSGIKFWALVVGVVSTFICALWFTEAEGTTSANRMLEVNAELLHNCESSRDQEIYKNGCINIYVQTSGVDAEKQYLSGLIYITPPDAFATQFGSSIQTKVATDVYLDAAEIDTGALNSNLYYEAFDYIRSIKFVIDLTNFEYESRHSDFYYPFDRYSGALQGTVAFPVEDSSLENANVILPIISRDYTAAVPGWQIAFDYDYLNSKYSFENFNSQVREIQTSGNFFNVFRIERSELTKAIAAIFALIFVGGALSLLVLLKSILLSHKRPTITGLVWAGSTTFTLIQTRGLLPGNPRPGVLFDVLVFYPALLICFVTSVIILRLWVNYEDKALLTEE